MDTFTDPEVEEMVLVKGTQSGGTESILNMMGYVIDQDQGPTLAVYPSDTDGEDLSRDRIQPMIRSCDVLSEKWDETNSKLLGLQFTGMYISLTGANSPAQLSSKPIRFLFMDEVDKYPPRAGKEASPIKLARERTQTYKYNRKIVMISTPTYSSGAIWSSFQACETQMHFYVPCPHCGKYQRLRWRWVIFDKTLPTRSQIADGAHYECMYCKGHIYDADKPDMLSGGEWRADKKGSRQKIGFHINALYSPWVTFRDAVLEFLDSKNTPETLMNFTNSWLAEPFEQVSMSADSEKILSQKSRYTRGVVPEETLMITAGVDKQEGCYYYTIRAWGENRRSWNIDHGKIDFDSDDDADEILLEICDKSYHDERGGTWYVEYVLMDSGNDTDAVYDFCYINQPLFAPVKGSSNPIPQRFRKSTIEKKDHIAQGMELIICDGAYYKNMIFSRINSKKHQDWLVFDGCDEEYARQISSEHKVSEKIGDKTVSKWKTKSSGADNHYLDCEVYAACAADVMGAFDLLVRDDQPADTSEKPRRESEHDDWLSGGDDWL